MNTPAKPAGFLLHVKTMICRSEAAGMATTAALATGASRLRPPAETGNDHRQTVAQGVQALQVCTATPLSTKPGAKRQAEMHTTQLRMIPNIESIVIL